MDKRSILIFEFFCLLIVASLGSFSLGIIITMVDFKLIPLLKSLEPIHWSPIIIGSLAFALGAYDFTNRLIRVSSK